MEKENYVLKNGMRVCICSMPHFESVGISVGIRLGSVDEEPSANGAAHYLEHMIFKGTAKRSAEQIKDEVRQIGSTHNANTGFESTLCYIQGYKGYFRSMLDLISDQLTNSVISKDRFERERGPIINENLIRQDDTAYFFFDNFTRVLFEKHPAKSPVSGGTKGAVEKIKYEDIVDMYEKHYIPKNMVLAVYGGVELEHAKSLITKHFGNFSKKHAQKARSFPKEKQRKKEETVERSNLKHAIVAMGFKCSGYDQMPISEVGAMLVLGRILYFRAYDEIRLKAGISYGPVGTFSPSETFAYLALRTDVELKNIEQAKDIMISIYKDIQEGRISEKDFKSAKEQLLVGYKMQRENTMGMANSIAYNGVLTGDTEFTFKIPEAIKNVTIADVKRYAKKYVNIENYSLLVLKPEKGENS